MTTPVQPAVPPTDMTKPVQPAVPSTARLARGRGEDLEEWFDRELRPFLLTYLGEVDRMHQDHRNLTFAALRHWLNEVPKRVEQQAPEARAFAKALVSELRGLLGDG